VMSAAGRQDEARESLNRSIELAERSHERGTRIASRISRAQVLLSFGATLMRRRRSASSRGLWSKRRRRDSLPCSSRHGSECTPVRWRCEARARVGPSSRCSSGRHPRVDSSDRPTRQTASCLTTGAALCPRNSQD
jgi:hypothetical protein